MTGRAKAITGGATKGKATLPKLPANTAKASPEDYALIEVCPLAAVLLGRSHGVSS